MLVDLLESNNFEILHSVAIYITIKTIIKVVDEANNITYDNIFIIMLPLFSCHSQACFYIPVLPSSNHLSLDLFVYTVYTCLVENGEAKGSPPRCLHHPSIYIYNIYIYMQLFCHPKYSILYGALMIFVVGSGQE